MLGTQFFWITSRAAGIVALILASVSVAVGLSIGGRLIRGRGPDLRVIHEALSLAALGALAVHVLALLGDTYFHASVADLTIPFVRNYRGAFMAVGIIAGWGMLLLGLSYYARERIGVSRWKVLHRFTALAWILGVVHSIGIGSDAGRAWFLAMTALAVGPPLVLLLARIARGGGRRRAAVETAAG